jgi:hypothetical protein
MFFSQVVGMLEKSVEEGVSRAGIKYVFLFLRFLVAESGRYEKGGRIGDGR